jgi:hypothetical protein
MRFVVEGQGLITMDDSPQIGSHGPDASQRVVLYMYVRALFFSFVTIKVTTRWMPCSYLYVLIFIEMYACILGQLI